MVKLNRYKHRAQFNEPPVEYAANGAIDISYDHTAVITKGSIAADTVAAPGAKNIGRKLRIVAGTDFAHVVTFTGSTLKDGTTGAKVTWTSAAFIGSSIEVEAISATQWVVVNKNLGTVA